SGPGVGPEMAAECLEVNNGALVDLPAEACSPHAPGDLSLDLGGQAVGQVRLRQGKRLPFT
ncbi:hypothetical protein ACW180_02210, partial [Limosilactobacillus fermentum]